MSVNRLVPLLITGRDGQLGRELVERCQQQSLDFVAFNSNELDITDAAAVSAAIKKHRPNAVINAAAYTAVDKAESESTQAHRVNAEGAANLAEACVAVDARLIHISTDYVFDGCSERPYLPCDPTEPVRPN